jgi:hypothetical protein
MGHWFERHLISLVFGFIGLAFTLLGGGFLWGYIQAQQKIEIVEQLPLYTTAQLTGLPADTLVAVEGRISEQNPLLFEGMVAYTQHQYQGVHCDDEDGDCEEVWAETERATPALWLDLPDGRVRVGNTDYELFNPPEVWQTTPALIEYNTLEYRGFRMGNPVYVIGEVNPTDGVSLNAQFVYGGSRQDYLLAQSQEVMIFLWMGGIFAGLGLIFLAVAIVIAVRM